MILVTGATGKTGSRVLAQLLAHGMPVRAQIRDASKVDEIPASAEVVVASFDEPAAWDAAVSGCDRIYLVSPPGPEQRRQEGAVIAAAVRSGARPYVVKIGARGLDDPEAGRLAVQHSQIRDDLRASGLPWTVLAVSQLMDNLLLYLTPACLSGVLPVPAGDARIAWVDSDDVAAVAVSVLTTYGHEGRTYEVTGPEALHHTQVAHLLGDALGREVAYLDVPPAQALAAMVDAGMGPWVASGLVETNVWYATRGSAPPSDVVLGIAGRVPAIMADYLDRVVRQPLARSSPA